MELSHLKKKMFFTIGVLSLIFISASAIYYRSAKFLPFALGVLLGSSVSIVKIILLARAVDKAVEMPEKNAGNYVRLQHMLRMLITGGALVIGALVPVISLWGTAAGIISFQMSLYFLRFSAKK